MVRRVPFPDPRGFPGTPRAAAWAPPEEPTQADSLGEWLWWSSAALRALARGEPDLQTAAAERATIARVAFLMETS